MIRKKQIAICEELGFVCNKPPHSSRKTFNSIMDENGVPDAVKISQMRRTGTAVEKQFYIFDRTDIDEKKTLFNGIFDDIVE